MNYFKTSIREELSLGLENNQQVLMLKLFEIKHQIRKKAHKVSVQMFVWF